MAASNVNTEIAEKKGPSVFKRVVAVLLVTVLLAAVTGYGGLYVLLQGPSVYAGDRFIEAAAGHPVGDLVLGLFLAPEELEQRQQAIDAREASSGEILFSIYPQVG